MGTSDNPPAFDTGAFAAADRFAAWRAGTAGVFDGSLPPGADPLSFHAAAECRLFGAASIISGALAAVSMTRSELQAVRDDVQTYAVVLYESGRWIGEVAGGRRILARPTVPVLLDMARPLRVDAQSGRYMILNLSRDRLDALLPADADPHGMLLEGAPGALLREQLLSLDRHGAGLSADAGDCIARSVAAGIAACIPRPVVASRLGDANLRRQAIRFIDGVLHQPDLSVDMVCDGLGVSRSTLYRAFLGATGVMATIRDRRLRRIARILSDPRDHRSMQECRTLYGFDNASHFSTAFSRRFGCSPRLFRNRMYDATMRPDRPPVFDHHGWTLLRR